MSNRKFELNEFFFYEAKSSDSTETRNPSGELDIQKSIQADTAIWKTPGKKIVKKKKLVLCDWSASQWSDDFLQKVKNKIKDLLDQSFEIYVAQRMNFVKITEDNINDIDETDFRDEITPATNEELSMRLSQAGIASDQISFITYEIGRKLITENEKNTSILLSDIVKSEHSISQIIQILHSKAFNHCYFLNLPIKNFLIY